MGTQPHGRAATCDRGFPGRPAGRYGNAGNSAAATRCSKNARKRDGSACAHATAAPPSVKALTGTNRGAYFGSLVDRFGVQWMFNCASKT